ncbi:MAG: alpha/beta fold hydrolase [Candidatus Shapirobacteria bacterium]
MSKWVGLILVIVALGIAGYFFWPRKVISPLANVQFTEKSLEKYDFDNLAKRQGKASEIKIEGKNISFISDGKKISGMMNMPKGVGTRRGVFVPVIIMIRGYAEKEGYYPGFGTYKVADELFKAGYATISLDFLGYGNSDSDSSDVLEARFHKVIEVLDLIQSVKQLPWVDKDRIGIWAHSNGGQIALSVLEITGEKYPTVLWAPMTLSFPQSLIDTSDPGEDTQKAIKFVNLFEKYYDSRRYAFENYYEWINAPILIQQGTSDTQVKVQWQQNVVSKLKLLNKDVELQIYDGADHNLKGLWQEAVKRDVKWFDDQI